MSGIETYFRKLKKSLGGDLPQNLEQLAQFQEEEVVLICRLWL
ncbi:MAG: hypothetical protein R3B93_13470 [Bacteroidia bacterium]